MSTTGSQRAAGGATGSVLLITGGERVMRQTFREHGRAYWSAEFGLILEKHGWVHFETAGPETLESPERLSSHPAVIVAWLPEDAWRPEYVQSLRQYEGVVLLEGPFPAAVEDWLEVRRRGEPVIGARGPLAFSPSARAYIDRRFGSSFGVGHRSDPDPSLQIGAGGDPNPLELLPRESRTRPPGLSRDAYADIDGQTFSVGVGRAAISMALAYRARFASRGRFFDDPRQDALALLACVRALAGTSSGPVHDELERLVREAVASVRPPALREHTDDAPARAIWGVALVEAAGALGETGLLDQGSQVLADARAQWPGPQQWDPQLCRWRLLLALRLADVAGAPQGSATALLEELLRGRQTDPSAITAWLDTGLARLGLDAPSWTGAAGWLHAIAAEQQSNDDASLGAAIDRLTLPDLMLVLGAMREAGYTASARGLWRRLVRALYDVRQGLFMNATVVRGRLVPGLGFSTNPLVALGLLTAAGSIDTADGPTSGMRRYTTDQLAAWSAAPYVVQPYQAPADETIATLAVDGREWPVIWRRGNVVVTAFQLLAHLVHIHTVEPLAAPFTGYRSGDAIALESLLMHLLGASLAQRPPAAVQIAPWPWDVSYVVTIRHDVDRILSERQFASLFRFERDHDLAVSWFWLPDRLEPDQLARLEREPSHEVGLHAVRIDSKAAELQLVGGAVGTSIVGEAIHGSGDGWLGHQSVRAALHARLLYTELAPPVADRPYARYPWVDAEGCVGADHIIGVTYNISIEGQLGTKPGSEGGPGIYRQLLNHPDLNFDRLQNWVASLPPGQRADWTCEQVARWWEATHVAGNLSIRHVPGAPTETRFEVSSPAAIEDLELRIPCPSGFVHGVSVDGVAAEWQELDEPEYTGIRVRITLQPAVARLVAVHGVRPAAAGSASELSMSTAPSS